MHSSYGRGIKSGASLRKYTLKAMTDVCKVFDAVLLTSLERRQMILSLAVHTKDCSRSLQADELAQYVGFTEDEVKKLCEKYNRDFDKVKKWYDGYLLKGI